MNKKIGLGVVVFLLLIGFVVATPLEALEQYYGADKGEDIDLMMSLTDFSGVDSDFKTLTLLFREYI